MSATPQTLPPPKPTAAPAPRPPGTSRPAQAAGPVQFGSIKKTGERVVIYGDGGIGKTSLALLAPGPIAFFDLDGSLSKLARGGTNLDHVRCVSCDNWDQLRGALGSTGWDGIQTIVVDSGTIAEEYATKWVLANIPTSAGPATSLESYGYGRGGGHLYDQMILMICTDLESHARAGRNVVLICHSSTGKVPNVMGEDYRRAEPFLFSTQGRNLRERVRDWADQVWYARYDLSVKDDKARSNGSRSIAVTGHPSYVAKGRGMKQAEYIYREGDGQIWKDALGLTS